MTWLIVVALLALLGAGCNPNPNPVAPTATHLPAGQVLPPLPLHGDLTHPIETGATLR
jgi:hypothetical protein